MAIGALEVGMQLLAAGPAISVVWQKLHCIHLTVVTMKPLQMADTGPCIAAVWLTPNSF